MPPPVCPGCGARLPEGATRCDLCGTQVGEDAAPRLVDDAPVEVPSGEGGVAPVPPPATPTEAPTGEQFCMTCGTANPSHARFCWQCGAALATATEAVTPDPEAPAVVPMEASREETRPPALPPSLPVEEPAPRGTDEAGKRALALVGGAALLVVVLFGISLWGGGQPEPAVTGATAGAVQAEPPVAAPPVLPAEVARQVEALEGEIDALAEGPARIAKQKELVEVLVRAGAFAQAGAAQEAVAEQTDTALAWADAGSFFLAHMLRTQGPDRSAYAQQAVGAYERSLARDSTDLDVKTDLATAYLNDPQNPMQAVETIRAVLDADPDHARARFNYGLMLAQIGRTDQAAEQFERVVELTGPEDIVHGRAQEELARLRAATAGTAAG